MSNEEKIEVAETRIRELETLIKHWKSSAIPPRKATLEIVESMFNARTAA